MRQPRKEELSILPDCYGQCANCDDDEYYYECQYIDFEERNRRKK